MKKNPTPYQRTPSIERGVSIVQSGVILSPTCIAVDAWLE